MPIPAKYSWLNDVGTLPRMVQEGLKLYGTIETPGDMDNPKIMQWAQETGLTNVYTADAVPWCGLFMAVVAKRAGKKLVQGPLWALNWGKWGNDAGQPELGDVLTFVRPGGGHVALYIGEDEKYYHVLGGNQSDAVTITRIDKSRMRAARNLYTIGPPASAKPYILQPTGAISVNES